MTPYFQEQLGCEGGMSQHDTLTLRDALRSIQYEAASLADAQVIALQALNATYPARAALSATQPAQAAQSADERAMLEMIDERDRCHEWADQLASAIAEHTCHEIGEHTSANNPWRMALNALECHERQDTTHEAGARIKDLEAQAAQSVPGVNKAVQLIPGMTKEQFAYVHHCALEVDAAKAETARLLAENAALKAQAAQGEPAEHWHRLYLEKCQQYNDRVAQLGGVIEGLEAEAAQGAGEVDTGPRVLREVLSVCEDTMDKMALETTEFSRGRAFEAKGISRAIGTWFQDEFCGLSHMGEPVAAPTQPAAGADVPPAQPAPVVPEGWEIREEATWVYFKRPDGFCQAVTPNDSHQSHAQTLHMLMRAMLAATPTPPAQAAADARDAERWRMAVLIQSETLTPPDHRKNQQALNAYIKALGGGIDFQGAIDAALATHQQRQGGAAIAASGRQE